MRELEGHYSLEQIKLVKKRLGLESNRSSFVFQKDRNEKFI